MALSSSSTIADARAQYRNSLGWRRSQSVDLANDLVEAIDFLIDAEPKAGTAEGGSFDRGTDILALRAEAVTWLSENASSSGTSTTRPRATRMVPSPRFRG